MHLHPPEKSNGKTEVAVAGLVAPGGDHGCLEIRRYYQSGELDWFADRAKWEGLEWVGMVESVREIDGQVSTQRRYFLSSLPPSIQPEPSAATGGWETKSIG